MRKIKFRAWHNVNEKFISFYESGIHMLENGQIYAGGMNITDRITLLQYTGLKDKNGTEIYEGDIIRFCDCAYDRTGGHMGDSIITGKVVYDYAMFFVNDAENGETGFPLCDAHLNDDEIEVIGNIYENPELLEGDNL